MNCANHPDRERIAFCQNCGKPLCAECSRVIGQAVFCEPCLAARLAGAPVYGGTGTQASGGYAAPGSPAWTGAAYDASGPASGGVIPPPSAPGEPNPGLAALLGFIPGVGAFYNGQYAKGVIHLIVFAVLISLTDEHGIFGLFIAGWIFYQVIEAHHTARARRDGTPLPNPFGLNDLGERLGFGRSWPIPGGTPSSGFQAGAPVGSPYAAPPAPSAASYAGAAPGTAWGAPEETFAAGVPPTPSYSAVPQEDPYRTGAPTEVAAEVGSGRGLPTGAFILIGLGVFFLIANTGHFQGVPVQWLVPVALVGLGVWLFVRRMTSAGMSLGDDGSPTYRYRLYSALRGSLWLVLVGVLFFLDFAHVLPWDHSWPLFIVVAGALGLMKRAAYAGLPPVPPPGVPMGGVPPYHPSTPPTSTSVVPTDVTETKDRS